MTSAKATMGRLVVVLLQNRYGLAKDLAQSIAGDVLDAVVVELRKCAEALGDPHCDLVVAARTMALRMEIAADRSRGGRGEL